MEKYYEDKKIIKAEDGDDRYKRITVEVGKDENDNDILETFDVSAWEFEVNSSDTPIDPSDARNNRAIYVVDAIYELFKALDIKTTEISYIIQKLLSKVQGIESQATLNCFGKVDEGEIRISDWENKL